MAPKKKKGKKRGSLKKLDKMTEEEKILYLEQKMLAEEETKKKKEDLLARFLADKLLKEEKYAKFNEFKLNNQWRTIMRQTKSKDLLKDIEILSQTFERIVDRKECVIKSLVVDLDEAEEQYSISTRSHFSNMDRLIDLQKSRIGSITGEFMTELHILKAEFDSERDKLIEQHRREIEDLLDITFAMEYNFNERESDAKAEFQSLKDEVKNKNLEEKHSLRVQLESAVEEYWRQFQQALNNYNDTTEQRKKAFEELKSKDERSAKEIERQMRRLQKIQEQISQFRSRQNHNNKEYESRNKSVRENKEMITGHYKSLKAQMTRIRDKERAKLVKLSTESGLCIKKLKEIKELGDQILRMAEMARKLETEEEKVLPFYQSSLTEEERAELEQAQLEPTTEPLAEVMTEYTALENFWKRYNKVMLDELALEKEKQFASEVNQRLRMVLKQYLDGISVNDEILTQFNPLFVVNQKTNLALSSQGQDFRSSKPVVIEASHIVNRQVTSGILN